MSDQDTSGAPEGYAFTQDWFSKNLRTWQEIVHHEKPTKILEIGSFEGRSTCAIIEMCAAEAKADIEVHCVDTWEGGIEHQKGGLVETEMSEVERRFDRNISIVKSRIDHQVEIIKVRKYSNIALPELMAAGKYGYFDLVYVDGSHQAPDVLTDAIMSFQLLRIAGMLIFDDYLWSMDRPGTQDVLKMPKPAIDAFINIFQRKMIVFQGAPLGQLYTRKISN